VERVHEFLQRAGSILLGKAEVLRLAFTCILARGHLLIEDIPGVGKTTLVHLLAQGLGLHYSRIQCTSDLLPADILGSMVFDSRVGQFALHKGPIFSQFILADELNRSTPKTQSALLQAMEEARVTIENESHALPRPFFVFATQNPHEHAGTYPLPESQIDRFLMRISIGYPDRDAEYALLTGADRRGLIDEMPAVFTAQDVLRMQAEAAVVHVAPPIVEYTQNILEASRAGVNGAMGLSPRAGLALIAASRAWAYQSGRSMVIPEDIQAVAETVIGHRILRHDDVDGETSRLRARELIRAVDVV
jgi:MoxR-like ATPase